MDVDPEVFRLSVPAATDQLSTVRLFAAAAVRHTGADEGMVEDLRLAVSEACTIALQAARTPAALVVAIRTDPVGVAVHVGTTAMDPDASPDGDADAGHELEAEPVDGWGTELLGAIVSSLGLEPASDGQIGVSFMLPFAVMTEHGPETRSGFGGAGA